jgi:hypothetical protein
LQQAQAMEQQQSGTLQQQQPEQQQQKQDPSGSSSSSSSNTDKPVQQTASSSSSSSSDQGTKQDGLPAAAAAAAGMVAVSPASVRPAAAGRDPSSALSFLVLCDPKFPQVRQLLAGLDFAFPDANKVCVGWVGGWGASVQMPPHYHQGAIQGGMEPHSPSQSRGAACPAAAACPSRVHNARSSLLAHACVPRARGFAVGTSTQAGA